MNRYFGDHEFDHHHPLPIETGSYSTQTTLKGDFQGHIHAKGAVPITFAQPLGVSRSGIASHFERSEKHSRLGKTTD
ncbi:MAG: hypothetical protein DRI65_02285 [Chloroflexota bacterium]|nr:MAG: hypothetical protein DRI65_02285 [Chloroflexota bacterium]